LNNANSLIVIKPNKPLPAKNSLNYLILKIKNVNPYFKLEALSIKKISRGAID
jgi:hypothetical protein